MATPQDRRNIELVLIVDKSGSMASSRSNTLKSINNFIASQCQEPGNLYLTIVLFNDKIEIPFQHQLLQPNSTGPFLTEEMYVPEGRTALYDAIGWVYSNGYLNETADNVIVITLTDGFENASQTWTESKCSMAKAEKLNKQWQFINLGSNPEVVSSMASCGLSKGSRSVSMSVNFDNGLDNMFRNIHRTVRRYRSGIIDDITMLSNQMDRTHL